METSLINALLYSVIPTLIGTFLTLYLTEKVKGNIKVGFDRKIEKLKKEHQIDVTKFQAEINLLKSKENFKFTKLHEKRFTVLEKMYQLLNKAINELNLYISPVKSTPNGTTFDENEDHLQKNFSDAHNNFAGYFSNNKLYLDDNITTLIENYLKEISDVYNDYSQNHFLRKLGDTVDPKIHMKAYTAYKKVPEKIMPIKKEIENSFKEILEK
ncbi:hypothetical protein I2486_21630 [Cellulophaga sp. E16_2]|uniref:hypothetical protein n=1 Tax=Cellulophaga sp. E16_2 TaxID=2789297 RepID=UPI001A923FC5|nr:hypothetical protein [Cellulophaga sp. E16_2]MBO0594010.1 hypothetical protein [Cellulophaga sp. E16_2]